jgi:hypothetical protein
MLANRIFQQPKLVDMIPTSIRRLFQKNGLHTTPVSLTPYDDWADTRGDPADAPMDQSLYTALLRRYVGESATRTGIGGARILRFVNGVARIESPVIRAPQYAHHDFGEHGYNTGFDVPGQDLGRQWADLQAGLPTEMLQNKVPLAVQRRFRDAGIGGVHLQPIRGIGPDGRPFLYGALTVLSPERSWSCDTDTQRILAADAGTLALHFEHLRRGADLQATFQREIIRSMMALATEVHAYVDDGTEAHQRRVAANFEALAHYRGYSAAEAEEMAEAALLHDIGKLGVPGEILHKPGALTAQEKQIVDCHTLYGVYVLRGAEALRRDDGKLGGRITQMPENWTPLPALALARRHFAEARRALVATGDIPVLRLAEIFARTHHEQLCGHNPASRRPSYPDGLTAGEMQNLYGHKIADQIAMLGLVDAFDGITCRRSYRTDDIDYDAAFQILQQEVDAGMRSREHLKDWRDLVYKHGYKPQREFFIRPADYGSLAAPLPSRPSGLILPARHPPHLWAGL